LCPFQVGACEAVTIDACNSYGTGGRPLTFTFVIATTILLSPDFLQRLPQDSSSCSVSLDRSALQPGLSYNVTVTATNFLLHSASAQVPPAPNRANIPDKSCSVTLDK
jgi:hypothetical protein